MIISHVVAASENNAIGFNSKLLWHLPIDSKFFNRLTTGHYILMGRKSWDALPDRYRPLPERINMVVTRKEDFHPNGAVIVKSIENGIALAKEKGEQELMIIGGGEIYRQSLPMVNRIYITRVHHVYEEADAYYPELNLNDWKEVSNEPHKADEKHKHDFNFIVLERK